MYHDASAKTFEFASHQKAAPTRMASAHATIAPSEVAKREGRRPAITPRAPTRSSRRFDHDRRRTAFAARQVAVQACVGQRRQPAGKVTLVEVHLQAVPLEQVVGVGCPAPVEKLAPGCPSDTAASQLTPELAAQALESLPLTGAQAPHG